MIIKTNTTPVLLKYGFKSMVKMQIRIPVESKTNCLQFELNNLVKHIMLNTSVFTKQKESFELSRANHFETSLIYTTTNCRYKIRIIKYLS